MPYSLLWTSLHSVLTSLCVTPYFLVSAFDALTSWEPEDPETGFPNCKHVFHMESNQSKGQIPLPPFLSSSTLGQYSLALNPPAPGTRQQPLYAPEPDGII